MAGGLGEVNFIPDYTFVSSAHLHTQVCQRREGLGDRNRTWHEGRIPVPLCVRRCVSAWSGMTSDPF